LKTNVREKYTFKKV